MDGPSGVSRSLRSGRAHRELDGCVDDASMAGCRVIGRAISDEQANRRYVRYGRQIAVETFPGRGMAELSRTPNDAPVLSRGGRGEDKTEMGHPLVGAGSW